MNAAHLHLLVNHLPILGFGFGILLTLVGLWQRREKGITIAACAILIIAAVGSMVAVGTGEDAINVIEGLPDVTQTLMHEHEERAEAANVAAIVTSVAALGLLVLAFKQSFETPAWAWASLLVLAVITTAMMLWVGDAGGIIRHTELRDTYSAPATTSGEQNDEHDHEHGEE